MKTIGFIGGGRITKIFLQALKNAEVSFEKVTVFDTNSKVLLALQTSFQAYRLFH
ncbi:MAG: hypothetical protein HXX14_10315 [Bacteroidetes bacterium]|nr:hypothetical protein [Bacteroidota bacterium]